MVHMLILSGVRIPYLSKPYEPYEKIQNYAIRYLQLTIKEVHHGREAALISYCSQSSYIKRRPLYLRSSIFSRRLSSYITQNINIAGALYKEKKVCLHQLLHEVKHDVPTAIISIQIIPIHLLLI